MGQCPSRDYISQSPLEGASGETATAIVQCVDQSDLTLNLEKPESVRLHLASPQINVYDANTGALR